MRRLLTLLLIVPFLVTAAPPTDADSPKPSRTSLYPNKPIKFACKNAKRSNLTAVVNGTLYESQIWIPRPTPGTLEAQPSDTSIRLNERVSGSLDIVLVENGNSILKEQKVAVSGRVVRRRVGRQLKTSYILKAKGERMSQIFSDIILTKELNVSHIYARRDESALLLETFKTDCSSPSKPPVEKLYGKLKKDAFARSFLGQVEQMWVFKKAELVDRHADGYTVRLLFYEKENIFRPLHNPGSTSVMPPRWHWRKLQVEAKVTESSRTGVPNFRVDQITTINPNPSLLRPFLGNEN